MDETQKARQISELMRHVANKLAQAKRQHDPVRAAKIRAEVAQLEIKIAKLKVVK
jgi:ribosomal protein L18E